MDYDALSPSQKEAVDQLQALTNGGDVEVAMNVLGSVEWDVQVSHISQICGKTPGWTTCYLPEHFTHIIAVYITRCRCLHAWCSAHAF